jgi:hypothetical protein
VLEDFGLDVMGGLGDDRNLGFLAGEFFCVNPIEVFVFLSFLLFFFFFFFPFRLLHEIG